MRYSVATLYGRDKKTYSVWDKEKRVLAMGVSREMTEEEAKQTADSLNVSK